MTVRERWRQRGSHVLVAVTVGLVAVLLLASVAAIGQIRNTQLEGTPTGKKLVAASDRILDCTNPGDATHQAGECYRRNQRNTARILTDAQRIIVLSAACSADLSPALSVDQRVAVITSCVTERLTSRK